MISKFKPGITVVIPHKDSPDSLDKALASVLSQTLPVNEILIIDDHSILDIHHLKPKTNIPIKIFNSPGRGVASARNFGVSKARYAVIAFIDADDIWHSNKTKIQLIEPLTRLELRGTYAQFVGITGKPIGQSLKSKNDLEATRNIEKGENLPALTSTWMVNNEDFNEIGGFDETFEAGSDFEFMNRFVQKGGKITVIRIPCIDYALNLSSISATKYIKQFIAKQYVQNRAKNPDLKYKKFLQNKITMNLLRKAYAGYYSRQAIILLSNQKNWACISPAFTSLFLAPILFIRKFITQFRVTFFIK